MESHAQLWYTSLRHCSIAWLTMPVCAQVYTISGLEQRLKGGVYKAMTDGKFTDGLRQVDSLLCFMACLLLFYVLLNGAISHRCDNEVLPAGCRCST